MTYQIYTNKDHKFSPVELEKVFLKIFQHFTWEKADLKKALEDKQQCFTGIFFERQLIGVAHFSFLFEVGEILNIGILPEFQGKGLGFRLLEFSINELCKQDVERVLLEVRASNKKAQKLYERAQFLPIAKRKNYYQEPIEDAFIYERKL